MADYKDLQKIHKPVLVGEVLKYLKVKEKVLLNNQARFIDATVGAGGHTEAIIREGGQVLGIDADETMLKVAEERLKSACPTLNNSVQGSFQLIHGNFIDIDKLARRYAFIKVSGILLDLGISSLHLEPNHRGFSFQDRSSFLDMRLDRVNQAVSAMDLVNGLRKDQLVNLFQPILGRVDAQKLAYRVVTEREKQLIKTVADMTRVVISANIRQKKGLDQATLPFLALRIAVNSELENINICLPKAVDLLENGGRLVVISFHSLEDETVEKIFTEFDKNVVRVLTKEPICPSISEIKSNPRSRSARMRVLEKI